MKNINATLSDITKSGVWGTIGPRMTEAGEDVAAHAGAAHALLVISKSAAVETLLRALEITFGDKVICIANDDLCAEMSVSAVGAKPLICENDNEVIEAIKKSGVKAIIAPSTCDFETFAKLCRNSDIKLIEDAGNDIHLDTNENIYASFCDLSHITAPCGAVITNKTDAYCLAFSHHHCGHPVGEGEGIYHHALLGGDFRINEWQAAAISHYIRGC